MTSKRLERAEDGYECLVISALAHTYRSYKECRGYQYHYGRGVTGTNQVTASKYAAFVSNLANALTRHNCLRIRIQVLTCKIA